MKTLVAPHKPEPILYFFRDYSHPLCRAGHRSAGEESYICNICEDLLWQGNVKYTIKKCKCCGAEKEIRSFDWLHMGLITKPSTPSEYW